MEWGNERRRREEFEEVCRRCGAADGSAAGFRASSARIWQDKLTGTLHPPTSVSGLQKLPMSHRRASRLPFSARRLFHISLYATRIEWSSILTPLVYHDRPFASHPSILPRLTPLKCALHPIDGPLPPQHRNCSRQPRPDLASRHGPPQRAHHLLRPLSSCSDELVQGVEDGVVACS